MTIPKRDDLDYHRSNQLHYCFHTPYFTNSYTGVQYSILKEYTPGAGWLHYIQSNTDFVSGPVKDDVYSELIKYLTTP